MDKNFNAALNAVLKHEGGFVNHPKDPGGATNLGITIGTFRQYVNQKGTIADLEAITKEQAKQVYKSQYWTPNGCCDLPSGIDYAVFDFAVNSGGSKAIKKLQLVVGVKQDGIFGKDTLAAVKCTAPDYLIRTYMDVRLNFLKKLRTWEAFGKGWQRRVDEVRIAALELVACERASEISLETTPINTPIILNNTKGTTMIATKKWYMSKTVWGAALTIASSVGMFGMSFDPDTMILSIKLDTIASQVLAAGAPLGGILAFIGRLTAKKSIK